MSLAPYRYRPATPDNDGPISPYLGSAHSRNTSGSSTWSSPRSVATRATTPSPVKQHAPGPTLLPKIRSRDQDAESDIRPTKVHRRALSSNCNPPEHPQLSRPGFQRSTTSPPECSALPTSVSSTVSTLESWAEASEIGSPVAYPHARRRSSHARSTSTPAIDAAFLGRHVNTNYRSYPVYTTQTQYIPAVNPEVADFVSPELTLSAPTNCRELTPELQCDGPTTTIMDYLTGPNPPVEPVAKVSQGTGVHPHFWWDVRNLERWDEFNLDTIMSIPGFSRFGDLSGLLDVPVAAAALPTPKISPAALQPATDRNLHDLLTKFYATKVNAALKTCQGHQRHISMAAKRTPEDGSYFASNYAADLTSSGVMAHGSRARVVGIVKTYNDWNTGMRNEGAQCKVYYLKALSQLQWQMREHRCRYGFIITEIELVCVRMGTESGNQAPYFGFLELSRPIAMESKRGLTAPLALWFLHMLVGDKPLQGQFGYKVEIGPPVAWSRAKTLGERDIWMPKTTDGELRAAKTRRGWKWPDDPLHRRKEGLTRTETVEKGGGRGERT